MLRAMLLAPVAVGVLAGTAVAGAGISSAAPAPVDAGSTATSANPGTIEDSWAFYNYTDQSVRGKMYRSTRNYGFDSYVDNENPVFGNELQPGARLDSVFGRDSATVTADMWGQWCYKGQLWKLPRENYTNADTYKLSVTDDWHDPALYFATEVGNFPLTHDPDGYDARC